MQLLLEILDTLLSPGFDRDQLLNEDQELLDAINVIGASSKERYDAVKLIFYKTAHQIRFNGTK